MKLLLRDILTVDFETFYSKDYSLSKKEWNVSSYVRDAQFKVHCVGLKDGLKPAVWYPGREAAAMLKRYGAAGRPILAHNTPFDGFILAERYGIVPPLYLDTLAMARGLHFGLGRNDLDSIIRLYGGKGKIKPKALGKVKGMRDLPPELLDDLGDYCCGDTDGCFMVARKQLKSMPEQELELIDWATRVFCNSPLLVDQALAQEELDAELARKVQALEKTDATVDTLQSATQLAEALLALGVEPPTKISLTTGEVTFAFARTDADFKALLDHDDPDVVALVEARLAIKSTQGETRARRFINIGSKPLPVGITYCAAHTTRFGGSNKMNLQNLKRESRLRRSIKAKPKHVLVVRDSGQIECRVNGWLSGETKLLEAFRNYDAKTGPDPYRIQAAESYNKPIEEITADERFIGKTCVLGLGYQMGGPRLKTTLALGINGPVMHIDLEEAYRLVDVYRQRYKRIRANWDRMQGVLSDLIAGRTGSYKCLEWEDNAIWLPNGLGLHYWELQGAYDPNSGEFFNVTYMNRKKRTKTYGGSVTENVVQALSRVIITEQMMTINERFPVVMMTHDEIVCHVHERDADVCLDYMGEVMGTSPKWAPDVPLTSEGGYDNHYSK